MALIEVEPSLHAHDGAAGQVAEDEIALVAHDCRYTHAHTIHNHIMISLHACTTLYRDYHVFMFTSILRGKIPIFASQDGCHCHGESNNAHPLFIT